MHEDHAEADVALVHGYVAEAVRVMASLDLQSENILEISRALLDVCRAGGRIYTCGCGGSACDAMHMAEELVARYNRERPGIRAQHLIDAPAITCWANDYSFASVFRRQVETLVTPADAVIGFSTSGNSESVLVAIEAANRIGALTIAFAGKGGGKIKTLASYALVVDSDATSHSQQAHVAVVHILCELLEEWLYPKRA